MVELIIIPDEEKLKLDDGFKKYKIEDNDKDGHLSAIKRFVKEYNIEIDGIDKDDIDNLSSYDAPIELAKNGYMNFHLENRNLLAYLPETLSNNQALYIKNNINWIRRFSIKMASINNENIKIYEDDEDDYTTSSMFNVFMKEVKKKIKLRQKKQLEIQRGEDDERKNNKIS